MATSEDIKMAVDTHRTAQPEQHLRRHPPPPIHRVLNLPTTLKYPT
jgi:hypothetical protein